ncbi:MAG TPA: DJ-1 family glyoxalase III [Candidatus Krumholzibacteria bacterium]|nr:DJ-1 family glyoxalase III [Candidatus Krumholzibacteria bacterium]
MARALVLLAEGFEEIETATVVDVLRRAEVEVVLAGLHGENAVQGSRGMVFVPDSAFDEADSDVDLLVLPGGSRGAENLAADPRVRALLRERVDAGRPVAAICAAPFALDQAGVLREGEFTCYPGWESRLDTKGRRHEPVVETEGLVTSQGPGTAMDFALALVARLCGRAKSLEVARALLHAAS